MDPAVALAAKLAEQRAAAVASLSPMDRSVRISALRDQLELHPERAPELEPLIEALAEAAR